MTDYMAQMLDELMGPSRNDANKTCHISFEDRNVCRHFLAGFCPNESFRNTKNDLGACPLRHDERLKLEYQHSPKFGKLGYEESFIDRIRMLDREVRRKIEKNTSPETNVLNPAPIKSDEEDNRIKELTKEVAKKQEEAQKLCEAGNVAAGEALVKEAEKLELQKMALTLEHEDRRRRFVLTANELNKPMTVCQICGCFMLINDAQSRIDDHLTGKLHVTYGKIRDALAEWDKKKEEERVKKEEERKKREEEREKKRLEREAKEKEKGDAKEKEREKDKDKKKDRQKSSKYRSRSRSRSRDRKRDKDRRHDRKHDRHRSSKHDRRDRSRSKDRKKREKS